MKSNISTKKFISLLEKSDNLISAISDYHLGRINGKTLDLYLITRMNTFIRNLHLHVSSLVFSRTRDYFLDNYDIRLNS